MNVFSLLAYLGTTVATVGFIYLVSARKSRPIYNDDPRLEGKSFYKLCAAIALGIGALLSLIHSFTNTGMDIFGFCAVSLTSLVTFVLAISIYTDHKHRSVDRVMLRGALILAITFGIVRLIELGSEPFAVLYAVGILLSFAIMFVPSIGASDSRAFMLLFAAGIPVLEPMFTYYAFLGGIGLWLAYGIGSVIKQRKLNVSIPMVPYILFPFVALSVGLSIVYGGPAVLESLG